MSEIECASLYFRFCDFVADLVNLCRYLKHSRKFLYLFSPTVTPVIIHFCMNYTILDTFFLAKTGGRNVPSLRGAGRDMGTPCSGWQRWQLYRHWTGALYACWDIICVFQGIHIWREGMPRRPTGIKRSKNKWLLILIGLGSGVAVPSIIAIY